MYVIDGNGDNGGGGGTGVGDTNNHHGKNNFLHLSCIFPLLVLISRLIL